MNRSLLRASAGGLHLEHVTIGSQLARDAAAAQLTIDAQVQNLTIEPVRH